MLPTQMKVQVISAFMGATRVVFIIFVPISVIVGILSLFVKVPIVLPHRMIMVLTSLSRMSDWGRVRKLKKLA